MVIRCYISWTTLIIKHKYHDDAIKMVSFSALLALCAGNSPVTGEFPTQRPVMRSFDVFFDLRLNKRLSKQSWGWWSETSSSSLWRHCNTLSWPQLCASLGLGYEDVSVRSRYQGQGQVITSHGICGIITYPCPGNLLLAQHSWHERHASDNGD